jgi:hypothetical protein
MTGKPKKKKIDFAVRPRPKKDDLPLSPEQWVREGAGTEKPPEPDPGPQKRLTLNLPADLHTAFKSRCVIDGVTIQEKVRMLIERELAPEPKTQPPV